MQICLPKVRSTYHVLNAKGQENKCICHFLVYVIRDGIFASSCRKCEEARIKHSKGISMLEISPNIAILLLIILLIFPHRRAPPQALYVDAMFTHQMFTEHSLGQALS